MVLQNNTFPLSDTCPQNQTRIQTKLTDQSKLSHIFVCNNWLLVINLVESL